MTYRDTSITRATISRPDNARLPGRYTPLVLRPEGGVLVSILPPAAHDTPEAHRDVRTSVYRYYDRLGVLLYVGITSRGATRNGEHNATKSWWKYVNNQQVEHYPTRDAAVHRERELIREFRPPFNVQHNPGHADVAAVYVAARKSWPKDAPALIRCVLVGRSTEGRPMLRSAQPIGRHFQVTNADRVVAKMQRVKGNLSRVTKIREEHMFLAVELLHDDPQLEIADVRVRWDTSTKPWSVHIISVKAR